MLNREVRCRCGVLNRVSDYRISQVPKCGSCGAPLPEPISTRVLRRAAHDWVVSVAVGALFIAILLWSPWIATLWPSWFASIPVPVALHPPMPAPPAPNCVWQPKNNDILELGSSFAAGNGNHTMEAYNGRSGSAIIDLLDASTGDLVVSFFVESNQSATVYGLSDGTYRIQWALGDLLGPDCVSFAKTVNASELDKTMDMRTKISHHQGYTRYEGTAGTFTLYAVPDGTARSHLISAESFYAKRRR